MRPYVEAHRDKRLYGTIAWMENLREHGRGTRLESRTLCVDLSAFFSPQVGRFVMDWVSGGMLCNGAEMSVPGARSLC